MKISPFDLKSCPPIAADIARGTRAVAPGLAALPAAWRAEIPGAGSVVITVSGIDAPARTAPSPARGDAPVDGAIVLAIARGPEVGRFAVARLLAARLVDGALGGAGGVVAPRQLGPAERSVLGALLSPALDPLGWSIALGGAAEPLEEPAIALRIDGAFGTGLAWLALPPAAPVASELWRARTTSLPVDVRLVIAATDLPTAAAAALAVGDAVAFDGTPFTAVAADGEWDARLALGLHRMAARIDPHGVVTVLDDLRPDDLQSVSALLAPTMVLAKEGTMDMSGPTERAAAALATAPIEVVAELARFTLRGDEVLGLAPGVVLTAAADRTRAITLRVGGEPWAEGELVDVDGQLGVRVTRLLRR